ncbi:MAG TPA: hypothetical protein VGD94_05045 [Vicinamibacterales bacterium]
MRKLWVKAWLTLDGVFDAATMRALGSGSLAVAYRPVSITAPPVR